MIEKVSGRVRGFTMLVGTLVLWIGSSIVLQAIFKDGEDFQQPIFVTLFNSTMSVALLVPRVWRAACAERVVGGFSGGKRSKHKRSGADLFDEVLSSLSSVKWLSSTVGVLWLVSQLVFNMSLLHTSVATNTVLSSTSSGFTFIFSIFICRERFRWHSFWAAFLSFAGCTVVTFESPQNLSSVAINNSSLGDSLALASAAMFALVSVLLRRFAPLELDLSSFMGMNGLLTLLISPILLFAAHSGGMEPFKAPSLTTVLSLTANALLGCTFANYLYTSALMLLSPIVTNVCLSLSIPLSALADEAILQQHRFSLGWALGAALVGVGVIFASFELKDNDESLSAEKKSAQEEELHSLLDHDDNEEPYKRDAIHGLSFDY